MRSDTFDWVTRTLLEPLEQGERFDGVLLALHGSMTAENVADTEGALLRAVRERIGAEVPLVATLDLHANITRAMVEAADALVVYHTVPHVDVYETGQRAARLLRRMLVDGARPVSHLCKLPLVLPAELADTQADSGPAAGRAARLQSLEAEPGVLAAGVATVQPWLDITELGASTLVVSDADATLARRHAERLAAQLWASREDYCAPLTPYTQAVTDAYRAHLQGGLTVLGEGADATTSGAPGDSTWLLAELLRYPWQRPAVVAAVAPELVQRCRALGAGARVEASLGGQRDTRFGRALALDAVIERLFDARFVLSGHLGRNLPLDMGAGAVLRQDNVRIVLTERTGPHFASQLFECAGIDPFAAAVLVAKSPCGFRAVYAGRAERIVSVRSPGCAPADFTELPYRRISRPLWPWDPDLHWSVGE
ncbi:MAG: M81 family metallopeptidase [Gammaproteobacteria bacterium]|nr:M81 family metallopeptidase [Gammaproteobacteria bacterium]